MVNGAKSKRGDIALGGEHRMLSPFRRCKGDRSDSQQLRGLTKEEAELLGRGMHKTDTATATFAGAHALSAAAFENPFQLEPDSPRGTLIPCRPR